MAGHAIPVEKRFWSKVDIRSADECWPWLAAKDKDGRGFIGTRHPHTDVASRVAYKLTFGEIPDSKEICHTCDNPSCVNPRHLFLGSHHDNMSDMASKGRTVVPGLKGSEHPMAKLTEENVVEIRALAEAGLTRADLANRFNITRTMVGFIITGKNWKHI